ncbi:MAG: Gfo/Idh/MocA family oxidoreductase [Planctomycetes bacterium]|nr:Gfo/Idh/MocA family oxidoreductase [Planctomycetota bacterium]
MRGKRITRRKALKSAAGAAAFMIVQPHVLGGPGRKPPSEKLNIAGIGIGGMGRANLRELEDENIVALCDVDQLYGGAVFGSYPQAKTYTDYRVMLEKQKDIEAVLIATPDHTHAVITLAAMRAGKHVYCQKPLTHTVHEAREVARVAKETGVITQMGIQGHSTEAVRLIREWIADGAIGDVTEVDAWCVDSYYPWGHEVWSPASPQRPTETPAVPSTLDWDLWIGPAPMRPFHSVYLPMKWRAWLDFGSGWMGDRGAHTLDPVAWALDLGAPTTIEATQIGQTEEVHCIACVVTYRFPARGKQPPVKVTWYDGLCAPRPPELEMGRKMGDSMGGAVFRGTKGVLMCGTYGGSPRLLPESRMREYKRPAPTLPRIPVSHEQNWAQSCKSRQPASAPFDYSGPLTEICQLGNIAKRVPGTLEWDAANMKITNSPEADALVRPPYREGWKL